MRLRLVKEQTSFDFFGKARMFFNASIALMVASLVCVLLMGFNFGIDFSSGTALRTKSSEKVEVSDYRAALSGLAIGDFTITEVFDPTFDDQTFVHLVKFQSQDVEEAAVSSEIATVKAALQQVDPTISFTSTESVGATVSQELIQSAVVAVLCAIAVVLAYIWIRFEWQFAVGAVLALIHDVMLTMGIFAVFGIKFDLAIIAALLTIVGYSLNDSVVVFDRARENLRRYKTTPLRDVLNRSINETLSRTFMTSVTTLIALITLLILGGDVIRGFVFAMTFGVIVGTYSSIFVASAILDMLGVKRDWSSAGDSAGKSKAST